MKARDWREIQAEAEKLNPWFASEEAKQIFDAETARIKAAQQGHALSALRKESGMTQKEVAEVMGVSQARISQIEHGQINSLELLRSYISAIGGVLELKIRIGGLSTAIDFPGGSAVPASGAEPRTPDSSTSRETDTAIEPGSPHKAA